MMNTRLLRSAIRVIYQLGECPNQLMESIIRVLVNSINENLPEWGEGKIAAHIIRRLCFIVGEVCLNQGCYLYFQICKQVSRNQTIYIMSYFFVPSRHFFLTLFLFLSFSLSLSFFPSLSLSLSLSVSLTLSLSLCLSHFLSLTLSLSLSLSLSSLWMIGNPCTISQNYLFLYLSLSLSKSNPLIALNVNLWMFSSLFIRYF